MVSHLNRGTVVQNRKSSASVFAYKLECANHGQVYGKIWLNKNKNSIGYS